MKMSLLVAGAGVLGGCLAASATSAQDAPPAPPAAPGAVTAPGTPRPGVSAPAPPIALPGVRTLMVFPFDNNTSAGGRALGEAVANALERGMNASRVYSATSFSPSSLLVERARQEYPPLAPDIAGVIDPTTGMVDQARAMRIASRIGMQALLLGSIEDYKYDKAANRVEIVAAAQILDATTGDPLRTAGVTGSATGAAGADESTVAQAAATDLASRILTGLSVPPPPSLTAQADETQKKPQTQAEQGTRRRIPGWIPAGILLGIVAFSVK